MKSKIISILIVIALLSCFFFMPKIIAQTLEEQKQENQENQEKAQKELEYITEELTEAVVKIQELDDTIKQAEKEIEEMNTKLLNLQQSVNEITQKLENVENDYEKNYKLMEKRLVVMYEKGNISYLELLLNSKNLIQFITNYYLVGKIVETDSNLLKKIKNEKDEIETKKNTLQQEKSQLKLLKVKQEQTRIIMQNNKTVQENAINQLTEEEKQLQQKIQEYKDEEQRIESLIQLATNGYEYSGQYTGGVMLWPIAKNGTYITSGYGDREHPVQGISKFHTGIDIGNAGFGAPVVAAEDGIVTMAGYYGGYGNCVIINHGNGLATLYGHGQKILTEVGKEVKRGDLIMEVGSTGVSTGPHLHFEVRINGVHVSPLPYLQAQKNENENENKIENEIENEIENIV